MPDLVYLTHSHPIPHLQERFEQQNYFLEHRPLIQSYSRSVIAKKNYDGVIATSFSSLAALKRYEISVKKVYCIGEQTAHYAQSLGYQEVYCPKIREGEIPCLKKLLDYYDEELKKQKILWLGSAQGVQKHYKILSLYKNIKMEITHWNWPDYKKAEILSLSEPGIIVISSISSALALASLSWNRDWSIILSSARLEKYINKKFFLGEVRVSSWIQAILLEL